MNTFAFVVGGIMPGIAILTFVIGMGLRIRAWVKAPQPGKMTLFPAPSEEATARAVLAETVFFPGLFRADKALWAFSWIFHVTLALVALGHLRVVTGFVDSTLRSMSMTPEGISIMSSTVGGIAGVVLLTTGALLLLRRLALRRVREISGVPDFFALLLILAIVLTGDLMRFGAHFDLSETRAWALSLISFSPQIPEHGMFLAHALLAFLLIMYIPFSKILHLGGIFFTQTLVKRS